MEHGVVVAVIFVIAIGMLDEQKNAKQTIDQSKARIQKIDTLYERLYEYNVSSKVTDSFFMELSHKYENEKEELKKKKVIENNLQKGAIKMVRALDNYDYINS